MDLATARAVLAEQHRAVLATLRADGTPQMSPVLVVLDDQGRVVVSTRETAVKVRNLRRSQNWDEYRAAMQRERQVLLQIELTSAGPDQAG